MTLKLAVSRSRPSVPYGANFLQVAFGEYTVECMKCYSIFRPHHVHTVHKMQPVAIDVVLSVVSVYVVCLCVGHMGELYKNAEPIKMPFWRS